MAGRERNPERSRERILDAALEEFADHGFAGARVEAIARRSGLNKQLISHHFGGKLGLYRAVMAERRLRGGGELDVAAQTLPDALAGFFERSRSDPEWIRVLLWESLEEPAEDDPGPVDPDRDDDARALRRGRYAERLAWIEAEQEAGRLPGDLEPDLLFLSLLGAALYPLLLPEVCEILTGQRPDDDAFAARFSTHLQRLGHHLSQGSAPATG